MLSDIQLMPFYLVKIVMNLIMSGISNYAKQRASRQEGKSLATILPVNNLMKN